MLMSSNWNRCAHLLLKARAKGVLLAPLSAAESLTLDAAYEIAKCILDTRIAQGETPVGRKIGFRAPKRQSTGDSVAALSGPISAATSTPISTTSSTPVWAPLFDSTVHYATDNFALHSLMKAQQPCITPELVFKLRRTPDPDCTIEELADALEWIAHGFEITVSPFPGWQFEAADAVAAFGLHRALIIGEPRMLSTHTRRNLGEVLACASVSLSRSDQGSTVLCAALAATRSIAHCMRCGICISTCNNNRASSRYRQASSLPQAAGPMHNQSSVAKSGQVRFRRSACRA